MANRLRPMGAEEVVVEMNYCPESSSWVEVEKTPCRDPLTSNHSMETSPTHHDEQEHQSDDVANKAQWLDSDCRLLISLFKELKECLGKTQICKNKTKMWKEISRRMAEHGCHYTPIQVEVKWRRLEKRYREALPHNFKGGRKRKIEYEKELGEILNDTVEELKMEDVSFKNDTDVKETITRQSNTSGKIFKKTTLRDQLGKTREEKRSAGERAQKREFRNAFLEAYERRTRELERRNDLFERFLKTRRF